MSKQVVDSVVDQEVETEELLERLESRLSTPVRALRRLSRTLAKLVRAGEISVASAEARFSQAFVLLALAEYAHDTDEARALVDAALARQIDAIGKLEGRLSRVPAVQKKEIRDRIEARKAAREAS